MTHSRRYGLSKSKITAFEQCQKKLWLSVHRPDLAEWDQDAEQRFSAGYQVGEIACALHPEGVMVEADPDLAADLRTTAELLETGHPGPVFEATFQHEGVLVRVDVLSRDANGGWHAAEVKSAGSVKDYQRGDLATQIWVMRGAGLPLSEASIRHIDSQFVLAREGDYDGLFRDRPLMAELEPIVEGRGKVVQRALETLSGEEPQREMGAHCSSPFDCEFAGYCGRDVPSGPEWPVSCLPGRGRAKWVEAGYEDMLDLPEQELPPQYARILAATRDGEPFHDRDGARAAMAKWAFPRAWLDFETIGSAVPRWIGTRPFQQVPFQFSLHLERADGTITHHEFLSADGSDPREACARALVEMIPAEGTIIAYYAPFERRVLRELARDTPAFAEALLEMGARVEDLLPVTRKCWYHRDQRGSWSIKAVLPTIAPELDYAALEVKDGGNAQEAWAEAADPACLEIRRYALAEALKAYCERDTWAMVRVAQALCEGGGTGDGVA